MEYLIQNATSIINILYCIIIGLAAAFTISVLIRKIYGKFIDALLKNEAESETEAKTLEELGIKNTFFLNRALSRKTVLSSLISCDNDALPVKERRFFLLPKNQIKALGLFGSEKLSPMTILVSVVLFILLILICQYIIPTIIK